MKKERADKRSKLTLLSVLLCCTAFANNLSGNASEPAKKTIDLTHTLGAGLPDFHSGNAFEYKALYTIEKDGYADGQFSTPEHYGTHMDAQSHFYKGGQSVDQIAPDKLILPCVVIDVRKEVEANSDYCLTVEKIKAFERKTKIAPNTAVLLLTGWSKKFSNPVAYRNVNQQSNLPGMHFPAFSGAAATYLVNEKKVAALGLDTLSADYGQSKDYPVHKISLAKKVFLIENLNNLELLPDHGATIFIGVLPIKDGTGSPARVLAQLPEEQ